MIINISYRNNKQLINLTCELQVHTTIMTMNIEHYSDHNNFQTQNKPFKGLLHLSMDEHINFFVKIIGYAIYPPFMNFQ